MAKRNITVQVNEDTIARAKVVAARRGLSVSALVSQKLEEMASADERYEQAKRHALAMLPTDEVRAAAEPAPRSWTRDDIYDRPILR